MSAIMPGKKCQFQDWEDRCLGGDCTIDATLKCCLSCDKKGKCENECDQSKDIANG